MAKANSTATTHLELEVDKLCNKINLMDCLSQDGFSEISSIAKLALSRLETPDGYNRIDDIANALDAIWKKADDIENCINSEAEEVGCNYTDEAQRRRWEAIRAHREAGKGGAA